MTHTPETVQAISRNIDRSRETLDAIDPRLHHWLMEIPIPDLDPWTGCTHKDCFAPRVGIIEYAADDPHFEAEL